MPEGKSTNRSRTGHGRGSSESHSKRSEAAKKGWETRRKNATKRG